MRTKWRKARRALIESRIIAREPNSPQAMVARARNRVRDHRTALEDVGRNIIQDADKKANKHANRLVELTVRSLALYDAITVANQKFDDADLSDIKLDSSAQQSIKQAIDKLMQVEIFSMVARELVDDRELRRMIMDMFTTNKFARGGINQPIDSGKEKKPAPDKQAVLRDALRLAVESF